MVKCLSKIKKKKSVYNILMERLIDSLCLLEFNKTFSFTDSFRAKLTIIVFVLLKVTN